MVDDILEYWSSVSRELAARFHVEKFETSSAMWSWENFSNDICSLRNRLGIGNDHATILGLQVDFQTGKTFDTLASKATNTSRVIPYLYYYSKAQDKGIGQEWVKFNTLRGSWACRYSFNEANLSKITSTYVESKEKLVKRLELLGARRVDFGDMGFEVTFLPMVKVLLVFQDGDEEFPASTRLLYDKNSIFYMPHEQLGEISWILASRVLQSF
jgi:hypothetical protein